MKIIIHHHHLAYRDENGFIWLSSVIGRWVQALSEYFEEVRLLLYESNEKQNYQDTQIENYNVKLVSLGNRIRLNKRFLENKQIKHICKNAAVDADILLIRGVTPDQFNIWRFTPTKLKIFLLVGSIQRVEIYSKQIIVKLLIFIINHIRKIEIKFFAKQGTIMLANSPLLVNEIEELTNKPARFVPTNSIQITEFPPIDIRKINNPLQLLYCGRLDLNKGLKELLYAVQILNQNVLLCNLTLIGEKTEPTYSFLINLTKELGISDLVRWSGFIPFGDELFRHYRSADIFILPSYSEGFPHVVWEAMANSCPVITTAVGGITSLIENETHALLIPPKEIEPIVISVRRLFNDNSLRHGLITTAYNFAKTYSVEACSEKLASLIMKELY